MPPFWIELLGQLHRPFHVGEEDGDLLALALEGGLGLQDFVGDVLGRVSKWNRGWVLGVVSEFGTQHLKPGTRHLQLRAACIAELLTGWVPGATG